MEDVDFPKIPRTKAGKFLDEFDGVEKHMQINLFVTTQRLHWTKLIRLLEEALNLKRKCETIRN